jgi:oxygen-dependent protoporphyrinogen oxidase
MARICIIGGGISGLTVAYKLQRDGHSVTVCEASDSAGGAIRSCREGEWLSEAGPNSIQDSDASVTEIVESLGLQNRLLEASTEAKRRYIVRDGKPVLVPNSPFSAISTPLFSLSAKLGVFGEPFRPKRLENFAASPGPDSPDNPGTFDESLADFVRRRLGQEFLDYAINPMVGGIFAGNPEKLSVKHAFPKVWALEEEFGSLIKGAIGRIRDNRKSAKPRHKKRVLSFPNGLSELTNALSSQLSNNLHLNATISKVTRHPNQQYSITVNNTESELFDHLIYAGTAWGIHRMDFENFAHFPPNLLADLTHAPVFSVTLGYMKNQIHHPLDGFGVLVPEVEKMNILGCLFTSSIFPNRAPKNGATLTTFIGGMRQPELVNLDEASLLKLVKSDLNSLLGVSGDPLFTDITRWEKAIPQYEVGFGKHLDTMLEIERHNEGFHFLGNFKNGISLDASIRFAWHFEL